MKLHTLFLVGFTLLLSATPLPAEEVSLFTRGAYLGSPPAKVLDTRATFHIGRLDWAWAQVLLELEDGSEASYRLSFPPENLATSQHYVSVASDARGPGTPGRGLYIGSVARSGSIFHPESKLYTLQARVVDGGEIEVFLDTEVYEEVEPGLNPVPERVERFQRLHAPDGPPKI